MKKEKTVTIVFTKDNLSKDFTNIRGCPIFCALKDAGAPVEKVVPHGWCDTRHKWHSFSAALQKVNYRLANSHAYNTEEVLRNRRSLIGKKIRVAL